MLPPGEWSAAIVGDQWVDDDDLMALSHGKLNRGSIKAGFTNFGDMLRSAQTGPLADQRGITADDLRDAFRQGEQQARTVAEKNGIKQGAYGTAYDSMASLRQDLANLAAEGNQRIEEIQHSKEPVEAKVPQIIAAIHQYRAMASITAAKYSGNVLDAMQRVLDAEGIGMSARQFAQSHGADVGNMFRPPDHDAALPDKVRDAVTRGSTKNLTGNAGTAPGPQPAQPGSQPPATGTANLTGNLGAAPKPNAAMPEGQPRPSTPTARLTSNLGGTAPPSPTPAPPAPATSPRVPGAPMMPSPGVGAPGGGSHIPASSVSPLTGAAGAAPTAPASPVQPVTPADLMHSFDKGMQAGTPLSATASPMPPPHPTDPQIPTTPTAGSGSVPVNAPSYDSPAPVAHAAAPDATPAPQVVAGPSAAAPAPSAPAGPLPAYASDIRPTIPAASAPVLPSGPSPSAMASSAPVHPSAGQGTPAGPTMVRQTPPPAAPSSPSSLGTEAVAATATGAIAGAASANATERARLERLVAAVARQQPRLAWAAGDRPDETTVLTTDLASGWIPPGIELPAAVTLLSPERRRGDIETLLGEVTLAAGYTPIHHVAEEDEPVPTSPRPRHLPDIDELGWELNQATQWRDGLPRLAHTLAKAATSGTGVLDKEVDLLQTHLREVSTRVLDSYPDNVDFHDVGNWQLLAAIEALVAGDKSGANYHLAWFRACNTTISQ
nr:hypothetical protein MFLOJ_02550 [Mycobacterium florentinum]